MRSTWARPEPQHGEEGSLRGGGHSPLPGPCTPSIIWLILTVALRNRQGRQVHLGKLRLGEACWAGGMWQASVGHEVPL